MATLKTNSYYKVIYNGKVVNNYAFREPTNTEKFVLGDEMVNSWSGREIKNLGWDKIQGITFVKA